MKQLTGQPTNRLAVAFIFSGDLWAGAEVVAYNLAKGLRNYPDIEITSISLNDGKLAQKMRELDIETFVIDESKNSFPQIYLKALSILRDKKVDIIHSHRYKENILAFMLSFLLGNPALVTTVHGLSENHNQKHSFKHWIIGRANYIILKKFFKKVVTVSENIKREMVSKCNFPVSKVQVIHNGLDVSSSNKQKNKAGCITIGSAGRLFPVKDYGLMVDIAAQVCSVRNDVRFKLTGDGPEKDMLLRKVSDYGLDGSFELMGSTEEIDEFYGSLDIYLNTSLHEGIPMAVLEAMAYEVPVVAPHVGGLSEIIDDGTDGFLIDSRNPKDYARKCMDLISDRYLRHNLAKNARAKVLEKFSLETMAERYHRLYSEVVNTTENKKVWPQSSQRPQSKFAYKKKLKALLKNLFWQIYGLKVTCGNNRSVPQNIKSILFVCKGNVCRSVLAEAIARKMAADEGLTGIRFISGGLEVFKERPPESYTILVAEENGLDLTNHYSKAVTKEMINESDAVLVMEYKHTKTLNETFTGIQEKAMLLPLFSDGFRWGYEKFNIRDPYGRPIDDFRNCYDHIYRSVKGLLKEIKSRERLKGSGLHS